MSNVLMAKLSGFEYFVSIIVTVKCDELTFVTFSSVTNVKSSHFILKHYLKRKLSSTGSTLKKYLFPGGLQMLGLDAHSL